MKFIEPINPTIYNTNAVENTPLYFNINFDDNVTINAIKKAGNYYYAGGYRTVDAVDTAVLFYSSDLISWQEAFGVNASIGSPILRMESASNMLILGTQYGLFYRLLTAPPFSINFSLVGGSQTSSWYELLSYVDGSNRPTVLCIGRNSTTINAVCARVSTISSVVELTATAPVLGMSNTIYCPVDDEFMFTFMPDSSSPRLCFIEIPETISSFSTANRTVFTSAFTETPKTIGVVQYDDGGTDKDLIFMYTEEETGSSLKFSTDYFATESSLLTNFAMLDTFFFNAYDNYLRLFAITASFRYIEFNAATFEWVELDIAHKKAPVFSSNRWNYLGNSNEVYFATDISFFDTDTRLLRTASYIKDDLVLLGGEKFRALKATNVLPTNDKENWELTGYDNTQAFMFSGYNAQTTRATTLSVSVTYDKPFERIALLNVLGSTVTVTIDSVLFATLSTLEGLLESSWYSWFFDSTNMIKDLYIDTGYFGIGAQIDLVFSGADTVGVGVVIVGMERQLGETELGSGLTFKDYSRKDEDEEGNYFFEQRRFARAGDFTLWIDRGALRQSFRYIESLRAVPTCWWVGDFTYSDTRIYGFVSDFSMVFENPVKCATSLQLTGIS